MYTDYRILDKSLIVPRERQAAYLDLTTAELGRYSIRSAILACAEMGNNAGGFEMQCSQAIAERLKVAHEPHKFFVPLEIQERQVGQPSGSTISAGAQQAMGRYTRRDLTVGTASGGGYLVATDQMSLIEVLRNRSVAFRMGAQRLDGLQGHVSISRQTGAATAVWLGNESSTITESQQTLGQLSLSPKTVGAYTEISRQLMLQASPAVEAMVTNDLGGVCAQAIDVAALRGSGSSGQPTGIVNTAGIGSVSGSSIAYAGIREFQTDVAGANVTPAAGGYVTTPTVADLLMGRVKFASTASQLWDGNVWDAQMCGFPAMSTNQMSAGTMIFGDWSEVIVADWGMLQIEVNPYANFQAGVIGVRAIMSTDVGLRNAGAFSLATSIT